MDTPESAEGANPSFQFDSHLRSMKKRNQAYRERRTVDIDAQIKGIDLRMYINWYEDE